MYQSLLLRDALRALGIERPMLAGCLSALMPQEPVLMMTPEPQIALERSTRQNAVSTCRGSLHQAAPVMPSTSRIDNRCQVDIS